MGKTFKYVSDFNFPSEHGFTGSAGRTMVKGYARGGDIKNTIRNERKELNRVEAKRKDAGQEIARVRSEMRYDKNELKKAAPARKMYPTDRREPMVAMAKGGMLKDMSKLGIVDNKNPGETKMHTAPRLPGMKMKMAQGGTACGYKKGGMACGYKKGGMTKAQTAKVGKVMGEFKSGDLHSGSKSGPVVKSRKQAVAIAMSEAGKKKK